MMASLSWTTTRRDRRYILSCACTCTTVQYTARIHVSLYHIPLHKISVTFKNFVPPSKEAQHTKDFLHTHTHAHARMHTHKHVCTHTHTHTCAHTHTRVPQLLQCLIHCADLSNPAKEENLAVNWSNRIMQESFKQGDEERRRGIPMNPLGDREQVSIAKCQVQYVFL